MELYIYVAGETTGVFWANLSFPDAGWIDEVTRDGILTNIYSKKKNVSVCLSVA